MAAPTVRAYATPTNNTDAAPAFTVTLPAGVTTGDLLIAFCANDTNTTAWTTSPGNNWVKIADETSSAVRLGVYAKIADATNTLSVAATNNNDSSSTVVAITVGTHNVTDVSTQIVMATAATGASGNANPPASGTVASKDWLAIAIAVVDMTATGDAITAQPSTYSATNVLTKSASSTSSVGLGVAHKALTAATSEDPGTFTNTSRAWLAKTLLIPDTSVTGTSARTLSPFTSSASGSVSTVPEAVDDLDATPGDTEVDLTWTAPADGGSAITDYIVQYRVKP